MAAGGAHAGGGLLDLLRIAANAERADDLHHPEDENVIGNNALAALCDG